MADTPIHACLIVDDTPINASFWWRVQQAAFGFDVPLEVWGGDTYPNQARAALLSVDFFEQFADFVERFNIRGKFTMLPCPAGLGRIDQGVRGYTNRHLSRILDVVRQRIAPRFDITPEVLTHSMALDIATGALLPHSETAWVSHLAKAGRVDELASYIQHGYEVLHNVGLTPRGLTVGGMTDPSGIAGGEMVVHGHHVRPVLEALWQVEKMWAPVPCDRSFAYVSNEPATEHGRATGLPELRYESPEGGRVFSLLSLGGDEPLAALFKGDGGQAVIDNAADLLVSPDLSAGRWIDAVEGGRPLVVTVHGQSINARNTMRGIEALTKAIGRVHERYGKRITWCTPLELCEISDSQLREQAKAG